MPRRTKLTRELTEKICKYIEIGVPFKYAALACGISERTFYNWLERGEKEKILNKISFQDISDLFIIIKAAENGNKDAKDWLEGKGYIKIIKTRDGDYKSKFVRYEDDRNQNLIKEWRLAVFKRDNYTCQICGKKKDLQAHHIKSWSEYPELRYDINNGITLCKECHAKFHPEYANLILSSKRGRNG